MRDARLSSLPFGFGLPPGIFLAPLGALREGLETKGWGSDDVVTTFSSAHYLLLSKCMHIFIGVGWALKHLLTSALFGIKSVEGFLPLLKSYFRRF